MSVNVLTTLDVLTVRDHRLVNRNLFHEVDHRLVTDTLLLNADAPRGSFKKPHGRDRSVRRRRQNHGDLREERQLSEGSDRIVQRI